MDIGGIQLADDAVLCHDVCKQYGGKIALNRLNLSIPAGRVAGILGPNGSGKSTLFRLLTGVTRQDSGEVLIHQKKPGWKVNGDIAYLPDRARWYADQTALQAFDWAEQFLPGFHRQCAIDLGHFMKLEFNIPAQALSRGQEARLMLILCISRRVPLIILDEPFSGIDAMSRERIIEALIDFMSDQSSTILISTHELYESEALFDYAVFLNEGRVMLAEDSEVLRSKYGSMNSTMHQLYR
jgi:ABC-2 type transport system ATP-binding protein